MLSVRIPVSSRLLVVMFGGSQKLHTDFPLHEGLAPLTPALFKSQLYTPTWMNLKGIMLSGKRLHTV